MAIDFERLRKNLDYELVYEVNGVEIISIKPKVGAKKDFVKVYTDYIKNKGSDDSGVINYIYSLVEQSHPDMSEPEKGEVKGFIQENISLLTDQTLIGFEIISKEELDKQKEEIIKKLSEESPN